MTGTKAFDFSTVHTLLHAAVGQGVMPGGVLGVGDACVTALEQPVGALEPAGRPVTTDTIYDVASLTKAVATTGVAMRLWEAGVLDLDAPVAQHVPLLQTTALAAVRFRDLLSHSSGLPAYKTMWRIAAKSHAPRTATISMAAREPLEAATGTRSIYSDLGFIVLGYALEAIGGQRLDALADALVFAPMGLARTFFVPLPGADARSPIAPTERCPDRGLVQGAVHDENAYTMGGVAGHAGLFSTVPDLGRVAQSLLASWAGAPLPGGFATRTVHQFFTPAGVPDSTWRLGWDSPSAGASQAGALWPRTGVGHLGFTGCSLWLDPPRGRWVVLLTNRVHPTRKEERFRLLRPALHDAIVRALAT